MDSTASSIDSSPEIIDEKKLDRKERWNDRLIVKTELIYLQLPGPHLTLTPTLILDLNPPGQIWRRTLQQFHAIIAMEFCIEGRV